MDASKEVTLGAVPFSDAPELIYTKTLDFNDPEPSNPNHYQYFTIPKDKYDKYNWFYIAVNWETGDPYIRGGQFFNKTISYIYDTDDIYKRNLLIITIIFGFFVQLIITSGFIHVYRKIGIISYFVYMA